MINVLVKVIIQCLGYLFSNIIQNEHAKWMTNLSFRSVKIELDEQLKSDENFYIFFIF